MTICEGSGHEDQPPAIRIQQQQLRSARQYRLVFQDQVPAPLLGIRDIFVRIRIRGSLPLTYLFGSASNSGSSVTLRMQIKLFFLIFFSYNLHACTLSSVLKILNFLLKFRVEILFCMPYFSPLNSFMRKGKDPDPYLRLLDPDPGGPKTSGSSTLDAASSHWWLSLVTIQIHQNVRYGFESVKKLHPTCHASLIFFTT